MGLLQKVLLAPTLTALTALASPSPSLPPFECRPPGPIIPKPTSLSSHPVFLAATSNLTHHLDLATTLNTISSSKAGWAVESTSFSIGITSLDSPHPVWEYHHLAAGNTRGTKTLGRGSEYLIGSISKVVTDLLLLKSGVDPRDSITEWIPGLKGNGSSLIEWAEVTMGQLAGQLAGIPPNYGFSEYFFLKDYYEELGFPHVDNSSYPPCGVVGLNKGCTKEQLIDGLLTSYPISPPSGRPVYSNIAFVLLALALEQATGKNYTLLLRDLVSTPLGMTATRESPGNDSNTVIPPVDNSWGSDYGINAPGGGLVSTLSDLSILLHAILNRTILPTESQVRAWLKPYATTGSLYSLVGSPWEVYRAPDLVPDHPHTVDVYGKGGAAYGYQSQMGVVDEYGVGVVVLTAGDARVVGRVYDAVLTVLVPAVDAVARDQAMKYAGVFSNIGGAGEYSTSGNAVVAVNVTIGQDVNSTFIEGMYRNGSDIIQSYHLLFAASLGAFLDLAPGKPRIFPADISRDAKLQRADGTEVEVVREDWRVEWESGYAGSTDLPGSGMGWRNCLSWTVADWLYYGMEPLDRIVFVREKGGRGDVLGVEVPFLRSSLLGREGGGE